MCPIHERNCGRENYPGNIRRDEVNLRSISPWFKAVRCYLSISECGTAKNILYRSLHKIKSRYRIAGSMLIKSNII